MEASRHTLRYNLRVATTAARTIRIPAADLAEIDRRAKARHMNRSEFMRICALEGGPTPDALWREEVDQRLEFTEALETRVKRLEEMLFTLPSRTH